MKQHTKSRIANRTYAGLVAAGTLAALAICTPAATAAQSGAGFDGESWTPEGYIVPGPEMEVKRNATEDSPTQGDDSGGFSPQWLNITHVTSKKYEGQRCGLDLIRQVSGNGPQTLTLSISESVSSQWSASVSISAKKVTAGVGFNVTKSFTVTQGTSYSVPKGKYGSIAAYPLYDVYSFKTAAPSGQGWAMKPVGVCFSKWNS
ncbi:hypothetical protein H3146_24800 [Streptomyces sp. OF3]|uniref:Secreted protein n=1 Tax=Streptomyces alkaliterrae TaxID=2213162 RepID=A0A7W3ZQ98_9ACTN|nr:hypothetical protein [Streptomyces alkaliterrae]MBB1256543.1 hypothetical protein [Streptomyces alkaliterrae]